MNKLVTCKACSKEIAQGTKKCIHCGKDQRNFFMQHKILSGLGILFILIIIAQFGNKDQSVKVGEKNNTTTSKTSLITTIPENKTPATKSYQIGDIVQLNNYNVVVNKVYTVKSANEYVKPQQGNKFLGIDCTVENISQTEQNISSLMMFKVVDKEGRACDYSILGQTASSAGTLDGKIGVGRKITGVYVIEIPTDKTGLELVFDSLFTSGQIIVKLN